VAQAVAGGVSRARHGADRRVIRWEWHGYRNSYVEIDGRRMQSVPGGSHWGGGVSIHARDQARIGLLMLRGGEWSGRRILSQEWIERMRVPCPLNPQYGYFWWLNTDRALSPSALRGSYFASGAGGNLTWIDPEHDLVAVLRWTDPARAMVSRACDSSDSR
jgi:CubicO group peptidase (beta-lactamase class C family)